MAISDAADFSATAFLAGTSPHEVKPTETVLTRRFISDLQEMPCLRQGGMTAQPRLGISEKALR